MTTTRFTTNQALPGPSVTSQSAAVVRYLAQVMLDAVVAALLGPCHDTVAGVAHSAGARVHEEELLLDAQGRSGHRSVLPPGRRLHRSGSDDDHDRNVTVSGGEAVPGVR